MCNKLAKVDFEQWNGFKGDRWKEKIDVRNFISMNYTPYDGDASFLEAPTEATDKLWGKLQELQKEERAKGGVLIWRQRLSQASQHMDLDILMKHERSGAGCRSSDRQASETCIYAIRRNQNG